MRSDPDFGISLRASLVPSFRGDKILTFCDVFEKLLIFSRTVGSVRNLAGSIEACIIFIHTFAIDYRVDVSQADPSYTRRLLREPKLVFELTIMTYFTKDFQGERKYRNPRIIRGVIERCVV